MKKQLFKNIFSNWAGFVVSMLIAFFMSPFIVHKLGNVYYGVWVIMMQFTGYLNILDLGVRSSVVKYIAEYHAQDEKAQINRIVSAAISMYAVIGLLAFGAALIFIVVFPHLFEVAEASLEVIRWVTLVIGLNVAQSFIINVFYGVLMGIQRYDIYNKINIVFAFVRAGLILVFLHLGYGIIALALIQLGISLVSNILVYIYTKKQLPYLKITWFRNRKSAYKTIVNYSFVTFFVNISQKISFQTDSFVIGILLGASAVTFFSIPLTLVEYMTRLVWTMVLVLIPLTSELQAKKDLGRIRNVLHRGTKFAILIGAPICTVYLFMGTQFVALWMGPEYAAKSRDVLIVLAVTHMFSLSHQTSRGILYGMAKHQYLAYCYVIEAIINLSLSLVLARHLGILGVALGTAIPHLILVLVVIPVIISRIVQQNVFGYVLKSILTPFLSTIPFAAACYLVNRHYPAESLPLFFTQVLVLMPVYLTGVWFISLARDERAQCMELLGKVPFFAGKRA